MEITKTIQSLSDAELCQKLSVFCQNERDALSDLLLHLGELDTRKAYLDLGYSSLFSYLRDALGYSEGSAQRRVLAARLLRKNPELYSKLRNGKLTLCAVVEIAKVQDLEAQKDLLQSAEGKSKKDVEKLVALHLPASAPKRERTLVRKTVQASATPLLDAQVLDSSPPPVAVSYGMYMEFDEETMRLLTEAKALVGGGKNVEVVRKGLKALIDMHSPKKREERRAKRAAKKAEKEAKAAKVDSEKAPRAEPNQAKAAKPSLPPIRRISRHIPAALRDKIIIRDEGRCTFVGPDGKRCTETHHLEVDHVELFSFGGRHTEENLRLLCRPHNQLMAERVLGREKMQRMRARR